MRGEVPGQDLEMAALKERYSGLGCYLQFVFLSCVFSVILLLVVALDCNMFSVQCKFDDI